MSLGSSCSSSLMAGWLHLPLKATGCHLSCLSCIEYHLIHKIGCTQRYPTGKRKESASTGLGLEVPRAPALMTLLPLPRPHPHTQGIAPHPVSDTCIIGWHKPVLQPCSGAAFKRQWWDVPGRPMVKTLCFQRMGHKFDPWSGTCHMLCSAANK